VREHEVAVVVRRGDETLVLHRSPRGGAYWHLVAGGVEAGETAGDAAARELAEEVGLETPLDPLAYSYRYDGVLVDCFVTRAGPGWEPALDHEHDDYRWCAPEDAVALLYWPEPKRAVEIAFEHSS
jgi:8-oxo-dGTP pyrophosphatase MutT (NUDIX family)